MKEFSTSAKKATSVIEGAEPIEFVLDDEKFIAYPPTSGQVALVMTAMSNHRAEADRIATYVDFLDSIFDDDGRERYRARLYDRNDPLDFEIIADIVNELMEEWTENPTGSPPASTRSRQSTGSRSTVKRRSTA